MIRSSEHVADLSSALRMAQTKYTTVAKTHEAKIPTKSGGEFRYSYAGLAECVAAVKPYLAEFGLSVTQFPDFDNGTDLLTTRLMHDSGQWLESTMRIAVPEGGDARAQGSAITYARRYAFCCITGAVADDDDDGAGATNHTPQNDTGNTTSNATTPTHKRTQSNHPASKKQTDYIDSLLAKHAWGKEFDSAGISAADASKWIENLKKGEKPPEPTAGQVSMVMNKFGASEEAAPEYNGDPF